MNDATRTALADSASTALDAWNAGYDIILPKLQELFDAFPEPWAPPETWPSPPAPAPGSLHYQFLLLKDATSSLLVFEPQATAWGGYRIIRNDHSRPPQIILPAGTHDCADAEFEDVLHAIERHYFLNRKCPDREPNPDFDPDCYVGSIVEPTQKHYQEGMQFFRDLQQNLQPSEIFRRVQVSLDTFTIRIDGQELLSRTGTQIPRHVVEVFQIIYAARGARVTSSDIKKQVPACKGEKRVTRAVQTLRAANTLLHKAIRSDTRGYWIAMDAHLD